MGLPALRLRLRHHFQIVFDSHVLPVRLVFLRFKFLLACCRCCEVIKQLVEPLVVLLNPVVGGDRLKACLHLVELCAYRNSQVLESAVHL